MLLVATACPREEPSNDGGRPDAGFPIKHVIVIVKENHTFDNYFGSFPNAEGISLIRTATQQFEPPQAPDETPRDLCHTHACALTDWNGGQMDGWESVASSDREGDHLAWAQYRERDIPNYWQYARTFTLADHFFANVLGPSFPGHTFFLAAQAGWATGNPGLSVIHAYWGCDQALSTRVPIQDQASCSDSEVFPCFDIPAVPDVLPAGVDWKFYGSNYYLLSEVWSMFNAIRSVRHGPGWKNVVLLSEFDEDVAHHTLPAVSWLVDQDLASEHPNVSGVLVHQPAHGGQRVVGDILVELRQRDVLPPPWRTDLMALSIDHTSDSR